MLSSQTIPVALDSTPQGNATDALARMVYFRFEADDPSTTLFLQTQAFSFPFILLGLEGIVLSPNAKREQFLTLDDLRELIDTIEQLSSNIDDSSMMFGTGSIWVPFSCLVDCKEALVAEQQVERGDVFRLSIDAFRQAWQFLEGRSDDSTLRSWFNSQRVFNSTDRAVTFSPDETKVFREWSEENLRDEDQPPPLTR